MSISLGANGNNFDYPQTGDGAWGESATNWASAVSAALSAIGLGGTLTANAVINLQSTTKGFLPPRMTTVQRDDLVPSEGLIIYNTTTDRLAVYNGGAWVELPSADTLLANTILGFDGTNIVSTGITTSGANVNINGDLDANATTVTSLTSSGAVSGTVVTGSTETVTPRLRAPSGTLNITNPGNTTTFLQIDNANTQINVGVPIAAQGSAGITFENSSNQSVLVLGPGPSQNSTFSGVVNFDDRASVSDGTVGSPGLRFKDDTDNGLYRIGTNEWGMSAGGVQQARVNTGGLYAPGHIVQSIYSANSFQTTTTGVVYTDVLSAIATTWEITITPKSAASVINLFANLSVFIDRSAASAAGGVRIQRKIGAGSYTTIYDPITNANGPIEPRIAATGATAVQFYTRMPYILRDSPATTLAVSYKFQIRVELATSSPVITINQDTTTDGQSFVILNEVAV